MVKMRIGRIFFFLSILFFMGSDPIDTHRVKRCATALWGLTPAGLGKAFLERREGFLILHLEGSPYEMGFQACQFIHDFEVRQKGTIQSIVFLPESLDFFVWAGHLPFGNFVKFNLKEELL